MSVSVPYSAVSDGALSAAELDANFEALVDGVNDQLADTPAGARIESITRSGVTLSFTLADDRVLTVDFPIFTDQGAWATSTSYSANDQVEGPGIYAGSTYYAAEAHTSGTFATDLGAGKWILLAGRGDDAAAVSWQGTYSGATTYAQGDGVLDGSSPSRLYVSKVSSNTGNTPASSPDEWQPVGVNGGSGVSVDQVLYLIAADRTNGSGGAGGSDQPALMNVETFTASGTYTPTSGARTCKIIVTGGGGGGGSADSTNDAVGSGGGAGGTVIYSGVIPTSTATVTIGAAGAAGSAGAGGAGGNSSVSFDAVTLTANGGSGGAQATSVTVTAGADGGSSSGGDVNLPGGHGGFGLGASGHSSLSGDGGSSYWAAGGKHLVAEGDGNAPPANAYGAGGGGGYRGSGTDYDGGAGAAGFVIIEEFS